MLGLKITAMIYFNKTTLKLNTLILKKIKLYQFSLSFPIRLLTTEEDHLLSLIEEFYPNYIKFPELMDVFDSHLSYENKKKKLRTALYQMEEKISKTLNSKSKIFIERKNKEDLRIKEIRIK